MASYMPQLFNLGLFYPLTLQKKLRIYDVLFAANCILRVKKIQKTTKILTKL